MLCSCGEYTPLLDKERGRGEVITLKKGEGVRLLRLKKVLYFSFRLN